jgi:tetratricopeptide (TPR) repeat protein
LVISVAVVIASAGDDHVATGLAERAAAARALFQQGIALADARRWSDAADRFERAYGIRPSPEIAYNHAAALERLGRLVRASEELRFLARDAQTDATVRAAARARLEALLARVPRLTIRLDGPSAGFAVTLDGRLLEPAMIGIELLVDPGSHRIEARRGMSAYVSRFATLKPGAVCTIVIDVAHPGGLPKPRGRAVARQ